MFYEAIVVSATHTSPSSGNPTMLWRPTDPFWANSDEAARIQVARKYQSVINPSTDEEVTVLIRPFLEPQGQGGTQQHTKY